MGKTPGRPQPLATVAAVASSSFSSSASSSSSSSSSLSVSFAPPSPTATAAARMTALAAAITHGTFNALAGVPLLLVRGGSALAVGPLGLAWQLATLVAVALLVAWDWRLGAGSVVRPGSAYRTGPAPV